MKCTNCGYEVPISRRDCPSCEVANGYPNVRLAETVAEKEALAARLEQAEASAKAGGYIDVLVEFGEAVSRSRVVMARPLTVIEDLLENPQRSYTGYYKELKSGARAPSENTFDTVRGQYDAVLFPNFSDNIIFAALTLSQTGVSGYGAYFMIFKDQVIAHRTTLFEENFHNFARRHGFLVGTILPPGYRATWENKGKLGSAKLYSKLSSATQSSDFPQILIDDQGGTGDSDFIEAHIFGGINWSSIDCVVGREPKTRDDKALWRRFKKNAKASGVRVETI